MVLFVFSDIFISSYVLRLALRVCVKLYTFNINKFRNSRQGNLERINLEILDKVLVSVNFIEYHSQRFNWAGKFRTCNESFTSRRIFQIVILFASTLMDWNLTAKLTMTIVTMTKSQARDRIRFSFIIANNKKNIIFSRERLESFSFIILSITKIWNVFLLCIQQFLMSVMKYLRIFSEINKLLKKTIYICNTNFI